MRLEAWDFREAYKEISAVADEHSSALTAAGESINALAILSGGAEFLYQRMVKEKTVGNGVTSEERDVFLHHRATVTDVEGNISFKGVLLGKVHGSK